MNRRTFLGAGASLLVAPLAWGRVDQQRWEREFAAFVEAGLAQTHTPGLGVAMVRGGQTIFAAGYGLADVQARRAVTPDTAFHLASVSKVVTGAAMLRLLEQRKYQLDEPVGPHLDFTVQHPRFPDVPITFRHLLTHTSSISDAQYGQTPAFTVAGGPSLPLREFLAGYLSPGGRWYSAADCFSAAQPGAAWSYSNVATALLGYLAGRLGPAPLDVLTQQHFFQPLHARHTAWRVADIAPQHLAKPYQVVEGALRELPPTGYPDGPPARCAAPRATLPGCWPCLPMVVPWAAGPICSPPPCRPC
jgi:CubicO group peptidase (beta-lactamase class C family)